MRSPPASLAVAALALASFGSAQFCIDHESVNASLAGTKLTGQAGYYIPTGTTSTDFKAYLNVPTNALGIPRNLTGGIKFVAGLGPGYDSNASANRYARAQRDITYGNGKGKWTAGFDICAAFKGTKPARQNLGSFSLQPSTASRAFIMLARWTDLANADKWQADYVVYTATGGQTIQSVPGTTGNAFKNLPTNKWYRWEADFDLTANQVLEVRITPHGGTTTKYNPPAWYLRGGQNSTLPAPTAFRWFAGSGGTSTIKGDGNVLAFDNLRILRTATGSVFGASANNPAGSLKIVDQARVGHQARLAMHNPVNTMKNGSAAALLLALGKLPGPVPLPGFGMNVGKPGDLLINPGLFLGVVDVKVWNGTAVNVSMPIPNVCPFAGLTLFFQGLMIGAPTSASARGLTEAAQMTIGG